MNVQLYMTCITRTYTNTIIRTPLFENIFYLDDETSCGKVGKSNRKHLLGVVCDDEDLQIYPFPVLINSNIMLYSTAF